ncbi:MAG: hypothetical protein AAFX76_09090, partial [Planctomycetota bacterium]
AALSPGQTGERFSVATRDVSPAAVDAGTLRELDAAVVLRPELVGASGWDALAGFAGGGGLVWVFPPPAPGSDAGIGGNRDWFGLMRSSMGLSWELGEGEAELPGELGLDTDTRPPGALVLLSADWSALLGPVRVRRGLDVTAETESEVWVSREDGGAFLLAAPVWPAASDEGGETASGGGSVSGGGRVLLWTSAVEAGWTNLATKPVFPAMLHDGLRGVLGEAGRLTPGSGGGVLAGDAPELGRRWAGVTALVSGEQEVAVGRDLVEESGSPGGETSRGGGGGGGAVRALGPIGGPGVYAAREGGAGLRLAVNVSADAGDVRALAASALDEWLDGLGAWSYLEAESPGAVLATAQRRTNLGWALLWVLLGLVLLEMALGRWFSHALAGGGEGSVPRAGGRKRRRIADAGRRVLRRAAVWGGAVAAGWPSGAGASGGGSGRAWVDGWLGLDEVSWAEATAVGWRYPLPAWAWVLIALGAAGAAWWSYRGLLGPAWVRSTLAGLRGLLVLLIAVLLAGPEVVRTDETVEEDVLLVLVDRSASMQTADTAPGEAAQATGAGLVSDGEIGIETSGVTSSGGGGVVSRDAALRSALAQQAAVFGPTGLGRGRDVAWLGFGDSVFELAAAGDGGVLPGLGEADGESTALRSALDEALRRAAGRPISGVVLFTDGRSPQDTGPATLARLERESVRVFAVPLGAERLPLDLAITRVDPPTAAFINDPVPVSVVVDQSNLGGGLDPDDEPEQVDPSRVTVRLVDTVTGETLDEQTLDGVGLGRPVRLEGRRDTVGEAAWAVEVGYEPPAGGEAELNRVNNVESFAVTLIDRPIRVLYIEGYPRWEYRYLKNMLIREPSIDSSIFLLSADRAFAQEGDTPITRLPVEAEEWRRYDVVVVGDVPAEVLSPEQRKQLQDLVAQRGAGVLWIGGPGGMPSSYGATLLGDLLPMRDPEAVSVRPSASLSVRPTELAERLSVMQLRSAGSLPESPPGSGASGVAWPEDLPPLRWVQDLGALKPSAETLALATTGSADEIEGEASGGEGAALVARLRFGAGQSVYVATDETWRWRYARGEVYFEQFWVQLVRMLGRSAAARGDERVRFALSGRRTPVGGTVVADLTVEDAGLLARDLPSVRVAVRRAGDGGEGEVGQGSGPALAEFELRPSDAPGDTPGARTYTAPWRADAAGELELVVVEPALAGLGLTAPLEVVASDDERRRAEADRPRLVSLAEATGGEVVELGNLARLTEPGVVRNLSRKTANDVAEPVWNSALALALVVGLIALEWVLRKVIRLV